MRIERQFGRIRNESNSPRTLDLDLILYDDHVINTPELVVPHPRMHEREFVLIPLAEMHAKVGRDAFHPVLKRTAMELLESLHAHSGNPSPPAPRGLHRSTESAANTRRASSTRHRFDQRYRGEPSPRSSNSWRRKSSGTAAGRKFEAAERYVSADLRDLAQVDRLANEAWDALGGLDILVCNAGADTLTGAAAKWSFDENSKRSRPWT